MLSLLAPFRLSIPGLLVMFLLSAFGDKKGHPNIVYILADDMGYGDVQGMNPENGLIKTPQLDKLMSEGMTFTDAHTCSSVCTPTRYGLLTGRYNWRTRLQRGVINGRSGPLIKPDTTTVATVLKDSGYNTAMVGKWHLGLKLPAGKGDEKWSKEIKGGPTELGFDYWYGISASLDFPPYIYIHNNKFVGKATAKKAFHRPGPAEPSFEASEVLDELGQKSVDYIKSQSSEKPFFLYVPLTSPHTPILPTEEWKGKSGLGDYGDFMMQTDDVIGRIIQAVDDQGFKDNTLVIVTSDNGCAYKADVPALKEKGHYPNGKFRGIKMDIWEGGHRVPHIVRWPAVIKAGSTTDALITLNDFMATCSEITGRPLKDNEGVDSVSFLSALRGEPIVTARKGIVNHSFTGKFAYREKKWKLILTKGSGGLHYEISKAEAAELPKGQLYDMEADPYETKNLFDKHPEIVERLERQLQAEVQAGRSTTGATQQNDVPVSKIKIWK